jgi:hypothetical protein
MRYRQEGWKVKVSRLFGYMSLVFISMCLLIYATGLLFSIRDEIDLTTILAATFFYLITVVGIIAILMYNFWKFPDIDVSENGINLRVFFYTKHINWKNIKSVSKSKNELHIFLTNKGLLLNRLYGLFDARVWDQPVVIFVSNEDKVNSLEEKISMRITTDLE